MIFHAGRAFYPATNVDRVRRHRRDRSTNIFARSNRRRESGIACSASQPAQRTNRTCDPCRLGARGGMHRRAHRILETLLCVPARIAHRSRARESREILEPVRCTIQALYVHAIGRTECRQILASLRISAGSASTKTPMAQVRAGSASTIRRTIAGST